MALQALQNFFAALVYSANTSFDKLLDSLLSTAKPSPQSGGVAKQALFSIAQCVAVLCLAAGDQKCSATVKMLTDILKDDGATNSVRFSLIVFRTASAVSHLLQWVYRTPIHYRDIMLGNY